MLPFTLATIQQLNLTAAYLVRVPVGVLRRHAGSPKRASRYNPSDWNIAGPASPPPCFVTTEQSRVSIRLLASLCITPTCRLYPRGVAARRSHPRGSHRRSMHDPGSELPRIPLPRTPVN